MCGEKNQVFTCEARVSGFMRLYNEEWLQVREDGGGSGGGAGASGGNGLTGPLIHSDVVLFFFFFFLGKAATSPYFKIFLFTSGRFG